MNAEKIMAAIGGISDKYIEEYSVVKPIKNDQINTMFIRRQWIYRLCGILTVIAIIVGICLPTIINKGNLSPFVLTAYALSDDGIVAEHSITDNVQVPVSLLETEDGLKGFLFSIDHGNSDDPATLAIFNAGDYQQRTAELGELAGVHLEPGKGYFFFVGNSIDDFENVTFFYSDREADSRYEITVQITENEGCYMAELKELKSFPVKTEKTSAEQ